MRSRGRGFWPAIAAGTIAGAVGLLFAGSASPETPQLIHLEPQRLAVFDSKCSGCHSVTQGNHGAGPSLFDIVGKTAGKVAGFGGYSNAMQNSNVVWTEANLENFIENPQSVVPGTSMPLIATTLQERLDIIEFLKDQVPPDVEGPFGTGGLVFKGQAEALCYYRNYLFGRNIKARYSLWDESVSPATRLQGPFTIDGTGIYSADGTNEAYGLIPPTPKAGLVVRVSCDGKNYKIPLDPAAGLDPEADLVMRNTPPGIEDAWAQLKNGTRVAGVPKGRTVTLRVHANDAEGDARTIRWRVTAGVLNTETGNTVRWTLPNSRGLHFAYVLVTDNKGGYKEGQVTVSTDANTVVPAAGVRAAGQTQPSDRLQANDHFLTFFSTKNLTGYRGRGADSRQSSCQYYRDIGAANGCTEGGTAFGTISFSTWKSRWKFDDRQHATALYANAADLNLQRDMHGIKSRKGDTPKGTAFYVCNHPNQNDPDLKNAIQNRNLVACVAMEHSVTPGKNGDQPFIKFLTFGPNGKLLQSVNLDGRGEKFMPGACVVCHGATSNSSFVQNFGRYPEVPGQNPNLGALFLPFDLDNFVFSRLPGFRRADQQQAFFKLNQLVRRADEEIKPASAVTELINGWYPGGAPPFKGNFVPPGWAGNEQLYDTVVKPACRTCHIAMPASFNTFNQFFGFRNQIASYVCGNRKPNDVGFPDETLYRMPNALVTFDNFWKDPEQRTVLRNFVKTHVPGATCALPNYTE